MDLLQSSLAVILVSCMSLPLSASDVGELRSRYLETVGRLHSVDVQFSLQSDSPSYSSKITGRWVRDGQRGLLEASSESGPIWESFDGVHGFQAGFDPESPGRIREIIETTAMPPQLQHSYCLDTWLGLRLKDAATDLSGLLASSDVKIVDLLNAGDFRIWNLDLGEHAAPGGKVKFRWSASLAERYGCLPTEMAATVVGDSEAAEVARRNLGTIRYRLSGWKEFADPLFAGEQWLPTEMEVTFTGGRWLLILSSLKLNSKIPDADFQPTPAVGTQMITETVPGQRTVAIHKRDEHLREQLQQISAELSDESSVSNGSRNAVADRGDDFGWRVLQWAGLLCLLTAGGVYAFRRM
ncbi:MAG: hypothetical protein SFV23_07110 [Planctomycetaceae bacterium]|nr:hypothetical protein [Planctomycetaceae bacterium]